MPLCKRFDLSRIYLCLRFERCWFLFKYICLVFYGMYHNLSCFCFAGGKGNTLKRNCRRKIFVMSLKSGRGDISHLKTNLSVVNKI